MKFTYWIGNPARGPPRITLWVVVVLVLSYLLSIIYYFVFPFCSSKTLTVSNLILFPFDFYSWSYLKFFCNLKLTFRKLNFRNFLVIFEFFYFSFIFLVVLLVRFKFIPVSWKLSACCWINPLDSLKTTTWCVIRGDARHFLPIENVGCHFFQNLGRF